jgi:hypothetical protein
MQVLIDREVLDEVESTVTNDEFVQYLLSHTVNFGSAALIVQTILDKVAELKETLGNDNEEI